MQITVNKKQIEIDADPDMPLLWALRDIARIYGPKYGCGIGACGACMVLVNGRAEPSCLLRLRDVEGEITTIEGLADNGTLHPVQQVWLEEQVPQCGYCQAGQIMRAVALLDENPQPTDAEIDEAMNGNLCRCGTYPKIRAAIRKAAKTVAGSGD